MLSTANNDLSSAKTKLNNGSRQIKEGEIKLNAAKNEIEAGKLKLETARQELDNGKLKLEEFEAGEAKINAAYDELKKNDSIKEKVERGMMPIEAAREVIDEETVKTTKDLTYRAIVCVSIIITSALGMIASFISIISKKVNIALIMGIIVIIISVAANYYGMINGYADHSLLKQGAISVMLLSIVYTYSIYKSKNI